MPVSRPTVDPGNRDGSGSSSHGLELLAEAHPVLLSYSNCSHGPCLSGGSSTTPWYMSGRTGGLRSTMACPISSPAANTPQNIAERMTARPAVWRVVDEARRL